MLLVKETGAPGENLS